MHTLVLVFHVLLAMAIIGLVLLQQGRGADAGASFGSGGSGTVFGAAGAMPFLAKVTAGLALLFILTSLGLAMMARQDAREFRENAAKQKASSGSVVIDRAEPAVPDAPAVPEAKPAVPESESAKPLVPEAPSTAPALKVEPSAADKPAAEPAAEPTSTAPEPKPAAGSPAKSEAVPKTDAKPKAAAKPEAKPKSEAKPKAESKAKPADKADKSKAERSAPVAKPE